MNEIDRMSTRDDQLINNLSCVKLDIKELESDKASLEKQVKDLKNQVLELDTSILELRPENLKLKLGTGKKKADHTHLILEENLGKMKDELYRKDE